MNKLVLASFLTLFILSSLLFFVIFLIMLWLNAVNLMWLIIIVIAFNLILFFLSPVLQDLILKVFYKSEFYTPEEFAKINKKLVDKIEEISSKHGFKLKKIVLIKDAAPAAFAYGSTKNRSRIAITEGLLSYLTQEELESVIAHELGHIANWDFAIMSMAVTITQLLFLISYSKSEDGDKDRKSGAIALIAFVFYALAQYVILLLSRIREYYADEFAARYTSPLALSSALLKVGYGIMQLPREKRRLINQVEALNFMGISSAKEAVLIKDFMEKDKKLLASFMAYDIYSPWAFLAELNSTHPLTGKRIYKLLKMAGKKIDIPKPDLKKVYTRFFVDALFSFMPFLLMILFALSFLEKHYYTYNYYYIIEDDYTRVSLGGLAVLGFGFGLFIKTLYMYSPGKEKEVKLIELLTDVYASPVRGKPIAIKGKIIGRGVPGYIFSEDWFIDDGTGIIYVDYKSEAPVLGELFFAIKKVEKLKGSEGTFYGWFFRRFGLWITLKEANIGQKKIRGHPILWWFIWSFLIILVGLQLIWWAEVISPVKTITVYGNQTLVNAPAGI